MHLEMSDLKWVLDIRQHRIPNYLILTTQMPDSLPLTAIDVSLSAVMACWARRPSREPRATWAAEHLNLMAAHAGAEF